MTKALRVSDYLGHILLETLFLPAKPYGLGRTIHRCA